MKNLKYESLIDFTEAIIDVYGMLDEFGDISVIAKYEEGIADNEKLRTELREVLETLKPLLKLPSAISSIVNSQPDMIKKGVAKRVNDILGFNKDNVKDVEKEQ